MAPLRILVNGAGVCGPAFACFLLGSSLQCDITILERSPELRVGGQQIDLREQGLPLMEKLKLLERAKEVRVEESGLKFVNSEGQVQGKFLVNDSGKGSQSFTSEYEIIRGDLIKLLYDESLRLGEVHAAKGSTVKYEFGRYATDIQQDNNVARVVFSDGTKGEYDLVVGADGQGSKTRRIMFGEEKGSKAFESRDLFICLWNQPKTEVDMQDREAIVHVAPKRRVLNLRTSADSYAQCMFAIMGKTEFLRDLQKNQSVEEQKRTWCTMFEDCGWETKRLIEGLKASKYYYMSEIGQVKLDKWSKGRTVLLGDAGYTAGPITGLGTTVSLMGAYTLAGALAENKGNIDAALEQYEKDLRPFIKGAQSLPPGVPGALYPRTSFGVACINWLVWTVTTLKLDAWFRVITPQTKKKITVQEYPALNLPAEPKSA